MMDINQLFASATEDLLQEGFEEGLKQATEQVHRKVLLQLLRMRFGGQVDATVEARVVAASLPQLDRWFDRLVPWPKLAPLLAD